VSTSTHANFLFIKARTAVMLFVALNAEAVLLSWKKTAGKALCSSVFSL